MFTWTFDFINCLITNLFWNLGENFKITVLFRGRASRNASAFHAYYLLKTCGTTFMRISHMWSSRLAATLQPEVLLHRKDFYMSIWYLEWPYVHSHWQQKFHMQHVISALPLLFHNFPFPQVASVPYPFSGYTVIICHQLHEIVTLHPFIFNWQHVYLWAVIVLYQ